MKRVTYATFAALALPLLIGGSAAQSAQCSATIFGQSVPFNCPDPVAGPQGSAGPQGAAGINGNDGANGTDGKDGADGRNGSDAEVDKSLAVSAALSTPVWLGDSEKFAVSGGFGFSDDETAFGATGVMRFDKNWSGFAGGASSTDGDLWSARAGLRFGW